MAALVENVPSFLLRKYSVDGRREAPFPMAAFCWWKYVQLQLLMKSILLVEIMMRHVSFFVIFVFVFAFCDVCLLQPCGHLLGKGWPLDSLVVFSGTFVTFPYDVLGQVWYLFESIPDLCLLSYFDNLYQRFVDGKMSSQNYF